MKGIAFAVQVVSCCLSAVSAQYLETTIPLPIAPIRLEVNTIHSKVYCFGSDTLVEVIDAATNTITAQLRMQTSNKGLRYNPTVDKVYCEDMFIESVYVFDGGTDSLVRTIPVPIDPEELYCDPVANKVYSLRNGLPGSFDVIDCARDSVIARFWVNNQFDPWLDMVYVDPDDGLLYNVGQDTVFVASTASDSIIAAIPLNGAYGPLCHDPVDHKAFCATSQSELVVLDCRHHEVIKTLSLPSGLQDMCWNAVNGKLYVAMEYNDVAVVNCVIDSVEQYVAVGGMPSSLCCDMVRNKVYCVVAGGYVAVISGTNGSVIKTITVGSLPWDIAWVPAYSRAFVANLLGGSVSVLRDTGAPSIADTPLLTGTSDANVTTIVRGILFLPFMSSVDGAGSCVLFDISGRKVLDLGPGANDVSRLAPGVYFVREELQISSRKPQTVRKVMVTK
jgi:DNA-binding beta-propeller fold protein YncE